MSFSYGCSEWKWFDFVWDKLYSAGMLLSSDQTVLGKMDWMKHGISTASGHSLAYTLDELGLDGNTIFLEARPLFNSTNQLEKLILLWYPVQCSS